MATPHSFGEFGSSTPSIDDAEDKQARDVAWWAKAILIWLLQVIGVSAAVIFGMFSALAWQNSEIAKSQAESANLLSMVALCTQLDGGDERYHALCESIKMAAHERLNALAVGMFGKLPEPNTTSTASVPSSTPSATTSTTAESTTSIHVTLSDSSQLTSELGPPSLGPPSESVSGPATTTRTQGFTTSFAGVPSTTTTTSQGWTMTVGPLPTTAPDVGSDIGVADKIAIAVGATSVFITILSVAALWPMFKTSSNRRAKRASRQGLQGQFSANVGSGQR